LETPLKTPTILLSVGETIDSSARSGIHRVAIELAKGLAGRGRLELVRWDHQQGHLRHVDHEEFDELFGPGEWPEALRPHPAARRVAFRFGDLIADPANTWLLDPEVGYHLPDRLEAYAKVLAQCREYGVRVASIFYDQIPLTHAAYLGDRAKHLRYLVEISRADLILPISQTSADALTAFYAAQGAPAPAGQIQPALLAEASSAHPRNVDGPEDDKRLILMVGTVEPRKRQVEFLRAFAKAQRASAAVREMKVMVVGSLHPAVAKAFNALVEANPSVSYVHYAPDWVVAQKLGEAAFTAFVSEDEGFGLPIVESLAAGVPCLCADFGSMAEVGAGGGCRMVDVRDEAALEAAIIELGENPGLRRELRAQIGGRRLRTWSDYADQIVRTLTSAPALDEAGGTASLVEAPATPPKGQALEALAGADVILFPSAAARDQFVEVAAADGVPGLLPHRLVVGDRNLAQSKARDLSRFRGRLAAVAAVEARYAALRQALAGQALERPCFLRIVISTYNRRAFVVENLRWLLSKVAGRPDVEVVVVDNASTDGTAVALQQAFVREKPRIVVNPANVGMLGNMRECATLDGAEYVWLIGDDDFIVPEQVDAILAALKQNRGVPLAYVNFAVYYRQALREMDTPPGLIAEQIPLAPDAIASGVQPVHVVAAQHDNLFTAIYINIWRSDVLLAAYDHRFEGKPFVNLEESIPCTKTILETYGASPAYWHKPVGIVGNAHNSWTKHRPRWHALLMPQALALARDAGVDPDVLWPWCRLQGELYDEARGLLEPGAALDMDEADAFDISWPSFRRKIAGNGRG